MWEWPWGKSDGPLAHSDGPDKLQTEFLQDLAKYIQKNNFNGVDPVPPVRMAISSSHGTGKAECKTNTIETPSGSKKFGDLQVGDLVFGADGKPTQILAIHERGILPVYKITFDDSTSVRVCGEHLWNVKNREDRRKGNGWKTLSVIDLNQTRR